MFPLTGTVAKWQPPNKLFLLCLILGLSLCSYIKYHITFSDLYWYMCFQMDFPRWTSLTLLTPEYGVCWWSSLWQFSSSLALLFGDHYFSHFVFISLCPRRFAVSDFLCHLTVNWWILPAYAVQNMANISVKWEWQTPPAHPGKWLFRKWNA